MPLLPGKENVGHNITVEREAGKPLDQATAIALHTAHPLKGEQAHTTSNEGGEIKACDGMY